VASIKIQSWHRQQSEPSVAYKLFRLFLEMGEERSLVKVQEETGRSYQSIASYSAQWKWTLRANVYDDHIRHLAQKAEENQIKKDAILNAKRLASFRTEEYSLANALLEQARQMLAAPLYEEEITKMVEVNGEQIATHITVKPAGWNKNTALKFAKIASEIMRLNLEMATQRIGIMNLDNPEQRLVAARAALDKQTENINQLVDLQLQANPSLDRSVVTQEILTQLPIWTAQDFKLPEDQIPLLIEGWVPPIPDEDALPLSESDMEM
jgi:hypothetical protein